MSSVRVDQKWNLRNKMVGTCRDNYFKSWISFTISAAGLAGGVPLASLRLRRCRIESPPRESIESIPVSVPWSSDKSQDCLHLCSNIALLSLEKPYPHCRALIFQFESAHRKHLFLTCQPLWDVEVVRVWIWEKNSEIQNHIIKDLQKSKSNLATSKKPLWWSKKHPKTHVSVILTQKTFFWDLFGWRSTLCTSGGLGQQLPPKTEETK